jgi:hypothetical protein
MDFVDRIYNVICRSELIKGAVTVESCSNRWASITSSSTAQYLAAAVDSEAPMSAYMSLNYESIWAQTSTPKGPAWWFIASSSSMQYLVVHWLEKETV